MHFNPVKPIRPVLARFSAGTQPLEASPVQPSEDTRSDEQKLWGNINQALAEVDEKNVTFRKSSDSYSYISPKVNFLLNSKPYSLTLRYTDRTVRDYYRLQSEDGQVTLSWKFGTGDLIYTNKETNTQSTLHPQRPEWRINPEFHAILESFDRLIKPCLEANSAARIEEAQQQHAEHLASVHQAAAEPF